jgi:hypothetical protein
MSDELGYITGDTAVTYNQEFTGQFSKYRAVESFSDTGRFSLIAPRGSSAGVHNNHIDLHHNEKLHLSTPGRLPVSKLQPLPASPSSASHKCPEKPFFLSNTTFHCSESNYDTVKASVERALSTLEEYDWSYFPNDCMVSLIVKIVISSNIALSPYFFLLFHSGNVNFYKALLYERCMYSVTGTLLLKII